MLILAEIDVNAGGYATGGGLAALAVVLLPALNKLLDWLDKRRKERVEFEMAKRKEDAEARLDSANLFREMIKAITTNSVQLDEMAEVVKKVHEEVMKSGISRWNPPIAGTGEKH